MSTSVEKFLISSVIRNGDIKVAMAHGLSSSMFHDYPEEWGWIEQFYVKHKKAPSRIAFMNQFGEDFRLKAVDDTSHFAEEVKKKHSRFLMTTTMNNVADLLADGKVEQAVQLGYTNMINIAGAVGQHNDSDIFSSYEDVFADAKRRLRRVEATGFAGVPTGFITLDERTGGPQPGDFWVVAARLGEGKSWTMQRMATTAVMNGLCVQYDALEQTRPQVTYRIHAFMSSQVGENIFRTSDLMQGRNFNLKEYKQFLKLLKEKVKGNLHVADASRGRVGLMTVASQIERNNPDVVYIDYLTLMDKKSSDWQDVSALSGGLKTMASEYGIPIVAAAQLNRTGMGKDPAGPEALAQSDSIGQDADGVITMKQTSPRTTVMKAAKMRNAEGGFKFYTHFAPGDGIFEEVTYDRYLDLKDMSEDD
jgi:replicative DNA helicase